jgi:hypothetical protein
LEKPIRPKPMNLNYARTDEPITPGWILRWVYTVWSQALPGFKPKTNRQKIGFIF